MDCIKEPREKFIEKGNPVYVEKSDERENKKFLTKKNLEKSKSVEKGKILNVKKSLRKTMSSIVLSMKKMF